MSTLFPELGDWMQDTHPELAKFLGMERKKVVPQMRQATLEERYPTESLYPASATQRLKLSMPESIAKVADVAGKVFDIASGSPEGGPLEWAGAPLIGKIATGVEKGPVFYSKAVKLIEENPQKIFEPQQLKGYLTGKISQDELKVIEPYLQGAKLSKEQLFEKIGESPIALTENVLEGRGNIEPEFIRAVQVDDNRFRIKNGPGDRNVDIIRVTAPEGSTNRFFYEIKDPATGFEFEPSTSLREAEQQYKQYIRDFENQPHAPKFSKYQLPGGKNYRELQIIKKRPSISDFPNTPEGRKAYDEAVEKVGPAFTSTHFDEPDILVHSRINDRLTSDNKPITFIEEIQSDWHQKGRQEGYGSKPSRAGRIEELPNGKFRVDFPGLQSHLYDNLQHAENRLHQSRVMFPEIAGVPDAPFKKDWQELMLKRVLRVAADEGKEGIAWTTGSQQAQRYDLSKQIEKIRVTKRSPSGEELFDIEIKPKGDPWQKSLYLEREKLPDYVGKEMAEKIANQAERFHQYEGLDLEIGGEGIKGFYDKIIPNFLNKYGKKYGVRVETVPVKIPPGHGMGKNLDPSSNVIQQPFFRITPEMREDILKGQPLAEVEQEREEQTV